MFLNSNSYKKNTFFVCSAALYLKDWKENSVQGWGTLISQGVSELKGYVVVEKWLELLLKVTWLSPEAASPARWSQGVTDRVWLISFNSFFLCILFYLLRWLQCTGGQLGGKGASGQGVHGQNLWWFSAEITAWVTANKLEKTEMIIIIIRIRVHMLP